MCEIRPQEVLVLALLCDRSMNGLTKVFQIVWDEVRQIGVLRMAPALFDGIQFRGIRRQPFKGEPFRMAALEVRCRRTVRTKTVPDDGHMPTMVAVQEMQQPDELVRVDVLVHHVEVER